MRFEKILWLSVFAVVLTTLGMVFAVSETTTSSNVTVTEYVAIGLSGNLSAGIAFGSLNPNTNDNNATLNTNGPSSSLNTTAWVEISSDSNVNVDLCIKDSVALEKQAGTSIPNANYTWMDNSTYRNSTGIINNNTIMSTSYQRTFSTNLAGGNNDYFRFWLDIPNAQSAGDYNNTVSFKGVKNGNSCT